MSQMSVVFQNTGILASCALFASPTNFHRARLPRLVRRITAVVPHNTTIAVRQL